MVKILNELWEKIKSLWNIYGGIAISTIIAWLTNWSKVEMDRWASYLILTITCISLLTFFKVVFKKKTNGIPDTIALQQKSVKTLKTALYPEKTGEELGNAIIYTVRGGKKIMGRFGKFIKWLWGNKYTLISIISNLIISATAQFIMYSDTLKDYAFFQEHKIVFISVVTGLCVLWLIDNIYCVVTKYGLENLNEIKNRLEEKKQEQLNKLKPEQKKALKDVLGKLKTTKKTLVNTLKDIDSSIALVESHISEFEMLKQINFAFSNEQTIDYQNSLAKLSSLNEQKANIKTQMEKLEGDIKRIEKKL